MEEEQPDLPCRINAEFRIGREQVKLQVAFQSHSQKASTIVPLLQTLTDKIVAAAVCELEAGGARISCGKGCSACCSQLVPVAEPEARYLLQLFETFSEERRARISRRYADIRSRLNDSKLLEKITDLATGADREARRRVGIDYFELGLPCPFLEEGCCSIHQHRPLSCREFLVVSPPEHCARNDPENVATVSLPRRASVVLYRFGDGRGEASARVVPLSLLFDWAAQHEAEEEPVFPAGDYCENFLRELTRPA